VVVSESHRSGSSCGCVWLSLSLTEAARVVVACGARVADGLHHGVDVQQALLEQLHHDQRLSPREASRRA